ncbi:MAG: M3 family metallopeptidase [Bdellovibrionales bacterium]
MCEISSLYMESLMTHPSLTRCFDQDAGALMQRHVQQRTIDLAQICLLSKIDLELHRGRLHSVSDLKKLVMDVRERLDLPHPFVTPESLTTFDHAFADEDYACTYYSYLLGFIFAHVLKDLAHTQQFWNFWRKEGPLFVDGIPLDRNPFERIVEERS